jgi:hypothetical protein
LDFGGFAITLSIIPKIGEKKEFEQLVILSAGRISVPHFQSLFRLMAFIGHLFFRLPLQILITLK